MAEKGEDGGGEGPLKNGTGPLDDSDDSGSNSQQGAMLAKSRSPAAMDGFQDGGAQGGYPGTHYPPGYNNNSGGQGTEHPDFRDYPEGGPGYRGYPEPQEGKMQYPQQQPYMRPPFSGRGGQPRYPRFGAQQQAGPTPTLNQLLQAPNQRYNSYEYPQQQKEYPANNSQWPRYPQQHPYSRNQVSQISF